MRALLGGMLRGYAATWQHTGPGGQAILLGCLAYISRGIGFSFLFPLFAKEHGLATSDYGLVLACYLANLVITLVPILWLSRRGWDRRLIMLGPAVSLLGALVLMAAPGMSLAVWALGAFLSGTSGSTFWVLSDPLLAESTPAEYRARVYALKFLAFTVGSSIGVLVAGLVPDLLRALAGLSLADAFTSTLVIFVALDLLQIKLFSQAPNRARRVTIGLPNVPAGKLPLVAIAVFAVGEIGFGFGYNSIRPYLSLYFTERHELSSGQAGLIVGSMALMGGIGSLLMPSLAARIGAGRAIAILRIVGSAAVALWFIGLGLPGIVALTLLYYGSTDGTEALYVAEIMSRLPANARDVMAGGNALLWSLTAAGAGYLSGWVQDHPSGGFGAAFALGIGGYIVSALWIIFAFPRARIAPRPESGPAVA